MKKTIFALAAVLALSACDSRSNSAYVQPQPQYAAPVAAPAAPVVQAAPAAPVIVQAAAPAPAHSGLTEMLTGGALGYMLGRSSNNGGGNDGGHVGGGRSNTVVNKTVVNKTVIVQNNHAPTPAPAAPTPAPVKAIPPKSPYAGYGAVQAAKPVAPSKPSAPSYSAARSTPSYSRPVSLRK